MHQLSRLCLAAAVSIAGLFHATTQAAPVEVSFDASFEGLGTAAENPLASGVIEIGWLDAGTSFADITALLAAGDFAGARDRFNTVINFPYAQSGPESFGDGLVSKTTTLVNDGDAAGLATYKDPVNGAAGKRMYAWIRNAASETSASQQAFVQGTSPAGANVFPPANDTLNFTDYFATFGTDSFTISTADVAIGTLAAVTNGSGIDTNGGSPADGTGLNGGTMVLLAKEISSTATVAFASATANVLENAGTVAIEVTRSGSLSATAIVQYSTADGSAAAGTDYTAASGTVTFAPNDTSETITIAVADRAGFQGSRSFAVNLAQPGAGTELGTPASVAVTIEDDEMAMPGQIVLGSATYSIAENGGQLAVIVRRIGGSDGAVSATVSTANGTATSPADFTAIGAQAVNFAAGDAADKTVNITIINDTTFEGDENFSVSLASPQGGATLGTPSTASVTILEDDMAPTAGALSFSSATYSVSENGGTATITVNRTGGTAGAVSVTYSTASGTATPGSDYATSTGTLSWAEEDGESKTFTVPILDDFEDEADETFTVTLSNPTNSAALAAPSTATVTITDNDNAGSLQWSAASYSAAENSGNATLTITRTGGSDGSVTITVNTANGTATAGADYTAISNQVVTLANGVTSANVLVPIADNATFSGDRDFTATLSVPTGGATLGTPATAAVTIVDDENASPGTFAFSNSTYTVDEPAGSATITVLRTGGTDLAVTVSYSATAGTANSGDFTETMGTLTFAQGETQKTFTVTIANDTMSEPNETVNLALSNPTNGGMLGSPSEATLIIISDDQPASIALSAETYTGTEGTVVDVVVLRSGELDRTIEVQYKTENGTARAGVDYIKATGTLTFGPNETSKSVPVTIKADSVAEDVERFKFILSLSGKTQGTVTLGTPNRAKIIIQRSGQVDQPDVQVAVRSAGVFAGKDVYNTTGNGQIAAQAVSSGGKATFLVRVQNDSNISDSFNLKAVNSGTANGATVRYYIGGTEYTARITNGAGITIPNVRKKSHIEIRVEVKFRGGRRETGYGSTITATSLNTPSAIDVGRVLGIIK